MFLFFSVSFFLFLFHSRLVRRYICTLVFIFQVHFNVALTRPTRSRIFVKENEKWHRGTEFERRNSRSKICFNKVSDSFFSFLFFSLRSPATLERSYYHRSVRFTKSPHESKSHGPRYPYLLVST